MLVSCKFKYGIMVIGSRSMSGTINKGDTTIFEQYANQSPDNGYIENKDQKSHYIITSAIILIIALFALSIIFILIYANSDKIEYFDYTENSDIDCKVYLKENTFFENQYLSTDHKYIASLISNIQADFDDELTTLEDVKDYVYLYNIDAVINVQDKDEHKSIYTKTTTLIDGQDSSANKEKI